MDKRILWTPVVLMIVLALVAGCTSPTDVDVSDQPTVAPEQPTAAPERPALEGKLIIFHAGSLTVPMDELAEAFQAKYPGVTFETEASGSRSAARKISELGREADVMMSADYTVIDSLLIPDFADWNIQFARNTMVVAYTDQSKYADEINSDNWYEILTREGVVYGHSDPDADPCGYRTLLVWQLAEKHYDVPGLYQALDEHCPPGNVRPKSVELIALLESGDMDYAFEYRSVAVQHGLKFIELPDEINLSRVEQADFYKQATVEVSGKEPGTTVTQTGNPIVYGVTVPKNAPSPGMALEFVKFLIGSEGQAIMEQMGQPPIVPPVAGDVTSVPDELKDMVVPSAATTSTTPTATPAPPAATSSVTLELIGQESKTLSLDEIKAMPAYEGWGGRKSSTGKITPSAQYKGVTLEDLCALVGGITPANGVNVVAKDGYAMTFSYNQLTEGDFVTYDPATGDEVSHEGKLWVIVAYERDGVPTSEETEGALRLAVVDSEDQVTDGHWWIKWVRKIEIKTLAQEWSLHLEGAISDDVDRGTFESGAAPNCHGTSWTDEKGRTWSGIPLWLLVGRVDDENKHDEGAFNDGLAEEGYEIKVIAADGYSAALDSTTVARNNNIIVAYRLDGEPLPEKNWPLRLVGPDLPKSGWVGNIVTIEVVLP